MQSPGPSADCEVAPTFQGHQPAHWGAALWHAPTPSKGWSGLPSGFWLWGRRWAAERPWRGKASRAHRTPCSAGNKCSLQVHVERPQRNTLAPAKKGVMAPSTLCPQPKCNWKERYHMHLTTVSYLKTNVTKRQLCLLPGKLTGGS